MVRLAQLLLLGRPVHNLLQVIRVERLGHVVEGPLLEGPYRRVHRSVRRHDDDHSSGIDLLDLLLEFHPVHSGHLDIHEQDVP